MDIGDYLVVVNAEKIRVTGSKLNDKMYHHHTGYIGNLKSITLGKLLKEHPERVIEFAVQGHAAEESAGPEDVQEAARVRGRQASARRAAAEGAGL